MISEKLLRVSIGGMVLAILLSACGASTADEPAQAPSPTEPPTVVPATQIPKPPTSTPLPPTVVPTNLPAVGTDITIDLPEGDPDRGHELGIGGQFGLDGKGLECGQCHRTHFLPGPGFSANDELPGIAERGAIRIAAVDYTGAATTPEQYLIESVLLPKAYVLMGNLWKDMPEDYGDRLSKQDLADIVAWMLALDE